VVSKSTRDLISKSLSKPIFMYDSELTTLIASYHKITAMAKELKTSTTPGGAPWPLRGGRGPVIHRCCRTGGLFRGHRLSYVPLLP
jgi:hypothetical protein